MNKMTTTYNIYSSSGFIGFCFIFNNGQSSQGGLSLFETIGIGGNIMMYQQATKYKNYPLVTTDIVIIRDLMQTCIPSLRTNGLTYSAVDNNGQSQTI
jgi:hypothetical protein